MLRTGWIMANEGLLLGALTTALAYQELAPWNTAKAMLILFSFMEIRRSSDGPGVFAGDLMTASEPRNRLHPFAAGSHTRPSLSREVRNAGAVRLRPGWTEASRHWMRSAEEARAPV